MQKNKFITYLLLFWLLAPLSVNSAFALRAYLPEYDAYRNIDGSYVNYGYQMYKQKKLQETGDNNFSWQKTESWSGSVQIKTVFDFYNTKRAERIDFVKKDILSRIDDRTLWPIGDEVMDGMIDKLQADGKYFVIKAEGEIIPIDSETLIYLYDYSIKWKEDLIDIVRQQVQKLQSQEDTINVEQRNTELNNIIKILDKFKIKYLRLKQYREGKVLIWRGNGVKVEGMEYFFINKLFTTPELNELIDSKDKNAIYFWTYIPRWDFKLKYYSDNEWLNNDVMVDFLWDMIYAWNIKKDQRVYMSDLYASTQDKFIYNIQQSNMEYFIIFFVLLWWFGMGVMMVYNFINNFRGNFRKTPEEL